MKKKLIAAGLGLAGLVGAYGVSQMHAPSAPVKTAPQQKVDVQPAGFEDGGRLILVAPTVTGSAIDEYNAYSDADRFVQNFPTEIQGAQSVERYIVPGSSKVVIYVPQQHRSPTRNETDEMLAQTQRIQGDISTIISSLHDQGYSLPWVQEGLIPEAQNMYSGLNQTREFLDRLNAIEDNKHPTYSDVALAVSNDPESFLSQRGQTIDDLIKYDGVFASYNDIERVLPGDTEDLLVGDQAMEAIRHGLRSNEFIDQQDRREDYALSHLDNYDVIGIVYGGAHDFGGERSRGGVPVGRRVLSNKDNINAYNLANREDQTSYIVITPQNYERLDE